MRFASATSCSPWAWGRPAARIRAFLPVTSRCAAQTSERIRQSSSGNASGFQFGSAPSLRARSITSATTFAVRLRRRRARTDLAVDRLLRDPAGIVGAGRPVPGRLLEGLDLLDLALRGHRTGDHLRVLVERARDERGEIALDPLWACRCLWRHSDARAGRQAIAHRSAGRRPRRDRGGRSGPPYWPPRVVGRRTDLTPYPSDLLGVGTHVGRSAASRLAWSPAEWRTDWRVTGASAEVALEAQTSPDAEIRLTAEGAPLHRHRKSGPGIVAPLSRLAASERGFDVKGLWFSGSRDGSPLSAGVGTPRRFRLSPAGAWLTRRIM